MKKYVILLIVAMAMALPVRVFANYLITLKNGKEMVTVQYWEDGDQIKFYRYGGITGLNRDMILKIEQTAKTPGKEIVSDPMPLAKIEDEKTPEQAAAPSAGNRSKAQPPISHQPASYTQEIVETVSAEPAKEIVVEDPYIEEFENLKKDFDEIRFREDTALYAYAKQLTGFRDKILNERLGHVYSEQLVEVYSMLAKVESAVKSN